MVWARRLFRTATRPIVLARLGLRERVELLGGQLAFGRGENGGARLCACIPSASAAESCRV
jgi:hypothetical protein